MEVAFTSSQSKVWFSFARKERLLHPNLSLVLFMSSCLLHVETMFHDMRVTKQQHFCCSERESFCEDINYDTLSHCPGRGAPGCTQLKFQLNFSQTSGYYATIFLPQWIKLKV